ncbi:cyclic GMP-AMP synthase [Chanos chanos]|uniref:Cyclic GMP-AMP synthase n=1 Tax=Chanos chanos TaxID=29144 RepID=A0A6J2V5Q1_CHACN|nr:cyclic GMP-AMP synthase [Chanos chanos]
MTGRGKSRKESTKRPGESRAKSPTPTRTRSARQTKGPRGPQYAQDTCVTESGRIPNPVSDPSPKSASCNPEDSNHVQQVVKNVETTARKKFPRKGNSVESTDGQSADRNENAPQGIAKKLTRRGSSFEGNPNKTLTSTLEKLKLRKVDRSEATRHVKDAVKAIEEQLKQFPWFKDIKELNTGSYFENVKIGEPDEFDVMMVVPVERVDIQPFGDDGAFYSVALKRPSKHQLDRFLDQEKRIKASEMLNEFRKVVVEAVSTLEGVDVTRKRPGCPAVTLKLRDTIDVDIVLGLEVHGSWPNFTTDGFMIENWLGRKEKRVYRLKPYYLVPKYTGRGGAECDGVVAKDAWRISFSHVEKDILMKHGHAKTCCEKNATPCCRKKCLKLLKYLLAQLKEKHQKELSKFCSYYAKTTLFHACAERVEDSDWAVDRLSDCFQQLLQDFEGHLRSGSLPNFFIPTQNLLCGLDRKSCRFLADRIEEQRNNGFPIFT